MSSYITELEDAVAQIKNQLASSENDLRLSRGVYAMAETNIALLKEQLAARDATIAGLRDALEGLVYIIDNARLENLARGVQLGQMSWLIKAGDKMTAARAALAQTAPKAKTAALLFTDAVRIARGCFDYAGGHRGAELEIFHHGIQTVLNSLEAAEKRGLGDTQVAALYRIGNSDAIQATGEAQPKDAQ